MMINEIIELLNSFKEISDYEIISSEKDSRELFYVLKNLEINRAVKTESLQLNIYIDFDKFRGNSTVVVTAADNAKTLKSKVKAAIKKAKAVKNPYYPLPDKEESYVNEVKTSQSLNGIALKCAKAIFKADVFESGWINSTEIFVSTISKKFINSKGSEHTYNSFNIEVEVIPTWENSKKEQFELYKFIKLGKIDYRAITKEVAEILDLARNRSIAVKLSDIDYKKDLKVYIDNELTRLVIDAFVEDLEYASVYRHFNRYNREDKISNTLFDITLKGEIDGCPNSCGFDGHGVLLKDKNIIENGIVKSLHGDIRFGYYLNEKPTGTYPCVEVNAKGKAFVKEPHLIIKSMSSPQLEESSGYFGGEVRLGMYFDGEKYLPVTGFSIAGNIHKDIKTVSFSKEQVITGGYKGPKYMCFEGLNVF